METLVKTGSNLDLKATHRRMRCRQKHDLTLIQNQKSTTVKHGVEFARHLAEWDSSFDMVAAIFRNYLEERLEADVEDETLSEAVRAQKRVYLEEYVAV